MAFESLSGLVAGDDNGDFDVFFHDLRTDETECVSVNLTDKPGNATSVRPALSWSGRFTAFSSDADGLVAGDGTAGGTSSFATAAQE